jgi:mRNA-degrading endonuclease toxin of MazEF toxin-antitoxin module
MHRTQRCFLTSGCSTYIVVAVSRQGRPIPFHVRVEAGPDTGLAADSWARCEQVLTVAKDRLGAAPRGRVSPETMRLVDRALVLSLGIGPSAALDEV